ncbi:hypothetical protein [Leisingera methylohalidivorans]|uniref:Uncharacterized protein n=1 Tax=Leisingera methylohalidivorans DSM 14336 TaxID=999552 RepID=V9VZS7_9RHOB|nr:hypothetical protein [Leisingera methylohalidivorans]AHD03269.1 hypothetical protein METH_17995 [Leisingera methylohalidivorans DSM 14336]
MRETHALTNKHAYRLSVGVDQRVNPANDYDAAVYRACFDRSTGGLRWRPSIHKPRWASRITLEVTDVRFQRLQDISPDDAEAEGLIQLPWAGQLAVDHGCNWGFEGDTRHGSPVSAFAALWDSINGSPRKKDGPDISWEANPKVVAITFRPHLCNIDEMEEAA